MKNRKSNTFSIDFIYLEYPSGYSSISIVSASLLRGEIRSVLIQRCASATKRPCTSRTLVSSIRPVPWKTSSEVVHDAHFARSLPHLRSLLPDAYENAQFLCDSYYLQSPKLELRCINGKTTRLLSHSLIAITFSNQSR